MMPSVFLACPVYKTVAPETMASIFQATATAQLHVRAKKASLLAMNCNTLWCEALKSRQSLGLTHFAMIHSDVGAEPLWLDTMLAEMRRVDADVLAAVISIKNEKELTSTGFMDRNTLAVAKLTFDECRDKPKTFTSYSPNVYLAINTGLMVVDFTKPWVEKVWFEIRDSIHKDADGNFEARVLSEDWGFSAKAARAGAKVYATLAVEVDHYEGDVAFSNKAIVKKE